MRNGIHSARLFVLLAGAAVAFLPRTDAQQPSNHLPQGKVLAKATASDAEVIATFQQGVRHYLDLVEQAKSGMPKEKSTKDIVILDQRRRELASRIKAARADAKQGDLFTPEAAALFRRLLVKTMSGPDGPRILASLNRAEPVNATVRVNETYPLNNGVPLQSTPPSLLLNLPPLPKGVEYRMADHVLWLRDISANTVVDYLPDALPKAVPVDTKGRQKKP